MMVVSKAVAGLIRILLFRLLPMEMYRRASSSGVSSDIHFDWSNHLIKLIYAGPTPPTIYMNNIIM